MKYEFKDTLFSMIIGWAINSAMILMAATTLYQNGSGKQVDDLTVAGKMLSPLLGNAATVVFALALCWRVSHPVSRQEWPVERYFPESLTSHMILRQRKQKRGVLLTMIPAW